MVQQRILNAELSFFYSEDLGQGIPTALSAKQAMGARRGSIRKSQRGRAEATENQYSKKHTDTRCLSGR